MLDLSADRYLARSWTQRWTVGRPVVRHRETVKLPLDLSGPYYVMVVTDPGRYSMYGNVLESDEWQQRPSSAVPLLIELPPPTDLVVSDIVIPGTSRSGDQVRSNGR